MNSSATQQAGHPELPLKHIGRGKVRDLYEVDADRLLMVTSDRISAFDIVLTDTIPYKGIVLTQLTSWWLKQLEDRLSHHLISADIDEIVSALPSLAPHRSALAGRTMLCRRTKVFPVECVVRGYLSGSAWKEYRKSGTLAGEKLAEGLRESDKLEPAIFSPATKADVGHDENITIDRMAEIVGKETASELERLSREIFRFGNEVSAQRGIIIADTKFEFGSLGGKIILIDEVLTPDSSRFWSVADYSPGRGQASFDKQPLRDYLEALRSSKEWDGEAPAPKLSAEVVQITSSRYVDAFKRVTGRDLSPESFA